MRSISFHLYLASNHHTICLSSRWILQSEFITLLHIGCQQLLIILSVNWRHITDLVSAKGKTKEVYCCDIVVLIVLFWCFWCVKDYNVISVYWNIVWWGCETISVSWLLFSPLPNLGQLRWCGVNWPRESKKNNEYDK